MRHLLRRGGGRRGIRPLFYARASLEDGANLEVAHQHAVWLLSRA